MPASSRGSILAIVPNIGDDTIRSLPGIPVIIADIEEFDWDVVARPYNAAALLNDRRFLNTLKIEQDNHEGAAEHLETMIRVNQQLQNLIEAELQ